MKIERNENAKLNLRCDDSGDSFFVRYTNKGEPFRKGVAIGIANNVNHQSFSVMLCDDEAKQLRDMLIDRYPIDS